MTKIFLTPFAIGGDRTVVPDPHQSSNSVSYNDGYTADYARQMGVDPLAKSIDRSQLNGILYDITECIRNFQAGNPAKYNLDLATAIGGYPVGSRIERADNSGLWINTVANNMGDPDAGAAGWRAQLDAGITSKAVGGANITLSSVDAENKIIELTGTLTANIDLIFPAWVGAEWIVRNATLGAFSINARLAGLGGVVISGKGSMDIHCVATGMESSSSAISNSGALLRTSRIFLSSGTLMIQYGSQSPITFTGQYFYLTNTITAQVEAQGGGGAGGGVPNIVAGQAAAGSGGAAGGYGQRTVDVSVAAAAGTPATAVCGAGGTGVVNANGNPGGTTSFGSLLTANGGAGGAVGSILAPGANIFVGSATGGTVSSADIAVPGGDGKPGFVGAQAFGGEGGGSRFGPGSPQTNSSSTLTAAKTPGAGGSGAAADTITPGQKAGSAGHDGMIIVREYA